MSIISIAAAMEIVLARMWRGERGGQMEMRATPPGVARIHDNR
jgi:hypothetical protein